MTTVPDPTEARDADPVDELTAALCRLIAEEISLDPSEPVDATTDLLLTGLVDSLGVVRIVQWIEDELRVSVEPTDVVLENFQTVAAMVEYVGRRRGQG